MTKNNKSEWYGQDLENTKEDREKLAKKVVQTIIEYHQKNPNEPIRLTGHSHGGNVNKLVTQMLVEKGHSKLISNLLFLGTPVRDDYKLNHQAVKTGKDTQGKNRVQNAYDKDDWVQKNGGDDGFFSPLYSVGEYGEAGQTVNDPKVKNVEVDAPGQGGLTEHTNMDSADVIKQLNEEEYRKKRLETDKKIHNEPIN